MSEKGKLVEFIASKTARLDNAWLRGGIQAIPVVGGTLDTWLFQFAEKAKQDRVEEALERLKQEVGMLEVNVEDVKSRVEEYGYLTERTIIYIAQDYRPEMREAYVKMLAKFMSVGFSAMDNKELYLQYLSTMSPAHLVVLTEFRKGLGDSGEIKVQPTESVDEIISRLVGSGIEQTLAQSLVNDLVTRGMVYHTQMSVIGGDTHRYGITPLGKKMLELVS